MARPTTHARSSDRRAAILGAALECFNEFGYDAASIERIRDRSGASIGSIYHHFGDKRGIAAALFLQGIRSYQHRLVEELGSDPKRSIRGVVRAHLSWVEQNSELARFLGERRDLEVILGSQGELLVENRRFANAFRTWLRPHVAAGAVRRLPTDAYLSIMIGPADLLGRRWPSGRYKRRPTSAAAMLGDAAWRALAGDEEQR